MDIILLIIAVVFGGWLLISPLIYIYWHFNRDVRDRNEKYVYAVFCGTLFAFTALVGEGLTILLFFVPESWGSFDEDGGFVSARRSIGYFVGFIAALSLMQLINRKETLEDHNKALRHEIDVLQRLSELDHLDPPTKQERLLALEDDLQEMRAQLYLTEQDKKEISILENVIMKLE